MNDRFGHRWEPSSPSAANPDAELGEHVAKSTTILVVEDDAHMRALARRVLTGQAYRVLEAANGIAALEIAARDRKIDMVVTDVEMPTIGVHRMIRRLEELNPELRVLIISGHTDHDLLCRGFDKGSDAFLQKPFSAQQLVAAVREALNGSARHPA